ncbi:methylated-DNA--[protein]-cysteine S-methyltransferase [Cutibacterium equinum]|uniref:Methylated-DNA--[protein]-cysteine S-methyltransferase n=1 Tax=Cutibacterium equinum TaxID=3016342 RepID=A0ABY7QWV7_9ACTN|nr:methylated-DNA--[protein]-cysteine S-methyltransferase [Cutibacterium equinum]WCC79200.1 methylated-DNA--[protein]-cysteine S-methyltransferase [Cutibacterium equinum]
MTIAASRRLNSPIGMLTLTATPQGLAQVVFDEEPTPWTDHESSDHHICGQILDDAARQISEYLSGSRTAFSLPLDMSTATPFRRDVLNGLLTIPYAHTITYCDLATLIGRLQAWRAVGNTCANNPLPIVIPCHRVVRSDGELGGYRGGRATKRFLVDMEKGHGDVTSGLPPV